MDKILDLKSRYQCLEELHDFAIAKIVLYQSRLKDKELPYLLELLDKGDEAMEEVNESIYVIW